jgi:glycosyltransferase involved in cell wall biosynthesis
MGVDLPSADLIDPEEGQALLRRLNIDGPLVAFLGANTYDKGACALALAAAELNRTGTSVNVAFAGPQSEELTKYLEARPEVQAALAGKIRILGFLDEPAKRALLSACDLLALPSRVDSFGIVLLEAWLHGKPVIGAAAGGIPDLVREGETGLLVPFGDAHALAAAIARLINDPDFANRLGSAGRKQVLAGYTWDATFAALESIYCAALAAPSS